MLRATRGSARREDADCEDDDELMPYDVSALPTEFRRAIRHELRSVTGMRRNGGRLGSERAAIASHTDGPAIARTSGD